uniref:Uncharacterized protein n=1 Tax=Lactuca sativa TaxID=4236 RepID=A0A9R1WZQ2_LACSA|nr:hypothetical protein LSAT_V11C800398400 [Lactuca sativa]
MYFVVDTLRNCCITNTLHRDQFNMYSWERVIWDYTNTHISIVFYKIEKHMPPTSPQTDHRPYIVQGFMYAFKAVVWTRIRRLGLVECVCMVDVTAICMLVYHL